MKMQNVSGAPNDALFKPAHMIFQAMMDHKLAGQQQQNL